MLDRILAAFRRLFAVATVGCAGREPPRAQRFDLELPIRYRALGDTTWREGRTQNISHAGMLFRVDRLTETHTPVEITFEMPEVIGGESGAEVICQAEIVRALPPASTDAQPRLAVRILEYRFVRGRDKLAA